VTLDGNATKNSVEKLEILLFWQQLSKDDRLERLEHRGTKLA
jgi:hypothetical protein